MESEVIHALENGALFYVLRLFEKSGRCSTVPSATLEYKIFGDASERYVGDIP